MPAKFSKPGAAGLTSYELHCGYIQRKERGGIRVDMWHEGACFHVRAHNFNTHTRLSWDSFEHLGRARAAWKDACGRFLPAKTKDTE